MLNLHFFFLFSEIPKMLYGFWDPRDQKNRRFRPSGVNIICIASKYAYHVSVFTNYPLCALGNPFKVVCKGKKRKNRKWKEKLPPTELWNRICCFHSEKCTDELQTMWHLQFFRLKKDKVFFLFTSPTDQNPQWGIGVFEKNKMIYKGGGGGKPFFWGVGVGQGGVLINNFSLQWLRGNLDDTDCGPYLKESLKPFIFWRSR